MNTEEFIERINSLRRANQHKWFWDEGEVNGKQYKIKCYHTFIQRLEIGGVIFSTAGDMKISEFKEELRQAASYEN